MNAAALCGSQLMTQTMTRVDCRALADRIELNSRRLDELGNRLRGRDMRPDEDTLWTYLEDAIEQDKATFADAVLMLTGLSPERIGDMA